MKAELFTAFINIFAPVVSGVVVVVQGVVIKRLLAAHEKEQSRSQKSWELKREEYCRILDALTDRQNYSKVYYECVLEDRKFNDEYMNNLASLSSAAKNVIDKATNKGALLISEEASASLKKLRDTMQSLDRTDNWLECLDIELAAENKCLEEILYYAERDVNPDKYKQVLPHIRPISYYGSRKRNASDREQVTAEALSVSSKPSSCVS